MRGRKATTRAGPNAGGGWRKLLTALLAATLASGALAYDRQVRRYVVPDAVLQRADGARLKLTEALQPGRPVVLTFMYTSCRTVCPITSQVLAQLDQLLGAQRGQVQLVSISIDPDHDTVERLRSHARRTGHRGALYTGDPAGAEAVQKAFDAWQADKMHHEALFLINADPARRGDWVRLTGLLTPKELLAELHKVTSPTR